MQPNSLHRSVVLQTSPRVALPHLSRFPGELEAEISALEAEGARSSRGSSRGAPTPTQKEEAEEVQEEPVKEEEVSSYWRLLPERADIWAGEHGGGRISLPILFSKNVFQLTGNIIMLSRNWRHQISSSFTVCKRLRLNSAV